MPVEPRHFFLYWAVGLILLSLLIFRRPRRGGMKLRLKGGGSPREPNASPPTNAPAEFGAARSPERNLNVIFQFNGHSWDAYEVLGLPAGSNYDSVRAAFDDALTTVDPTSRPFIEAAFRAITTAMAR